MANDYAPTIQAIDMGKVSRWLSRVDRMFIRDAIPLDVFRFICDRTLSFNKYAETIYNKHFLNGIVSESFYCTGISCSERHLRRSKGFLINEGIVFHEADSKLFIPNLPGFINSWRELVWPHFPELVGNLEAVFLKVEEDYANLFPAFYYPNLRGDEVMMAHMVELMEEAREKSASALERKRLQRNNRVEVRVADIAPLMREFCLEHGLTYSEQWTGRTRGSARNFIRYCGQEDKDPRDALREVVQFWRQFRFEVMKRDDGRTIVLRETVSFTEYFNNRQYIDSWIALHRNQGSKDHCEGWVHRTEEL